MRIPFAQNSVKTVFALVLVILVSGCATFTEQYEKLGEWVSIPQTESGEEASMPQKRLEGPPQTAFCVHTVTWPGESLSIIAKWYTGTLDQWKVIAKANPEIDPNMVRTGMKIRIPEEITTHRNPMPQEFVASFYAKGTKDSVKNKPSPSPEVEPQLVGPKAYSDK